jgi:hypothetical protein
MSVYSASSPLTTMPDGQPIRTLTALVRRAEHRAHKSRVKFTLSPCPKTRQKMVVRESELANARAELRRAQDRESYGV